MKNSIIVIALLVAIAAKAQTGAAVSGSPTALPKPTAFSPVSRDGSSTVWERTLYLPGTNGTVVARKSRYVELASGLNVRDSVTGQFKQSKEEIDVLPQGGAQAVQGQHQAYFPGDIFKSAITLVTPDGKKLKGRPILLSYDDGTNTVLLGVLTNSAGVLVGSNRVVYPSAFSGIQADIVYDYRKGSFCQSVVLREQPPTPQSLGLSPNAQLQLLTEFTGSPDPVQKAAARNRRDNLQDSTLTFGKMKMIQGRAFSVNGGRRGKETPTFKSWMRLQNRTFLIETVPYQRIAPQLQQLPMMSRLDAAGTNLLAVNSILGKVSPQRLLPPELKEQTDTGKILLAGTDWPRQPGVVLDYEAVVSSTDDFTFQSGETYYVSGGVYLSGLTTIQGGTVIKYDTNYVCGVNILGSVQCTTSPSQPAVLTSADDNSVGEAITTGGPNNGTGSLTLWVTGDSGVNLADLTIWIWDENWNYIADGQSLVPAPYWLQMQGQNYEPFIFPAGVGQGYSFGADCDGLCWVSGFSPTLNTGTLTLGSGTPDAWGYSPWSYSETGDSLATLAGAAVGLSLPAYSSVNDLVIRNLGVGVQSGYGLTSVTNAQFIHCGVAFDMEEWASLYAGNILMSQVDVGFSGQDFSATAENLTFDQGSILAEDDSTPWSNLTLVNSLLTGIADYGNVAFSTNAVVMLSSGSGVYQTADIGDNLYYLAPNSFDYYLAPDSPYRNVGTTAINPNLWAELQMMTTYAPQDGGYPDNDGMPDLGYHHVVYLNSLFGGVPAWWLWQYFGNYNKTGANQDSGGIHTLLYDYQHNLDPNVISFSLFTTNNCVNTSVVNLQVSVSGGVPSRQAVLVNSTNFAGAAWTSYTSSNLTVNLGSMTQGNYAVWVGLRGLPDDAAQTWQEMDFTIDTTPPVLVITNPTATTLGVPLVQVQGYAGEQLAGLTFDVSNATGVVAGQLGFVMSRDFDTNRWAFTTNYFQCFDIMLAPGTNLVSIHATDVAGNTATNNLLLNLDFSIRTNLPLVSFTFPQDGLKVSGGSFTVNGFVDDPTATIAAQIVDNNGNTNTAGGVVERSGRFWVDNLPLSGGTNVLALTVTDAAGHSTNVVIGVIQSTVALTLNLPEDLDQLWQPAVNLSGTITGSGYDSVSVNGQAATVNGNSWSAANVPVTPGGVAMFTAMAMAGGQAVAATNIQSRQAGHWHHSPKRHADGERLHG